MKRLTFLVVASSFSYAADARIEGPSGLSGELTVLLGASYEKSNFNTNNKGKPENLNTKGSSDTEFLAVPLGQLRYTLGTDHDHQIFISTLKEDITVGDFALELGYRFDVGEQSSMGFSYLTSLVGETFADPYLTDQDRKIVDVSSDAIRFRYNNAFNTALSLDIAYYTVDLDEELSGSIYGEAATKLLDRNGSGIYSKLSYSEYLSSTSVIEPSFIYRNFSADGDAMSYDQIGIEIVYRKAFYKHALSLSAKYKSSNNDSENPIFLKTQNDKNLGLFSAYKYQGIAGFDNLDLNAILGYEQTTSNIDFYEEKEAVAGLGLTFNF
ncbi:DUF2860 domain-containing protein [Corallincola luteus]|uniref:DUF2860 domain-containing protein n=1 Tax=Corallincola luteus TaxID=1775177 RepID=A0ABY2AQ67_9GAMM|nr:DUF2860 family protein [Corallincola luteus]TCI05339.1 DUF2860 domain-containing protein [Corallincola luteus]